MRFSFLIVVFTFLIAGGVQAQNKGGFTTNAPHAVIIDFNSQEILFQKAATNPMPPASMTKIMTAFMVFEALESGQITRETFENTRLSRENNTLL